MNAELSRHMKIEKMATNNTSTNLGFDISCILIGAIIFLKVISWQLALSKSIGDKHVIGREN